MTSKTKASPILSSGKDDWQTPEEILDLVRTFASGPIAFDPCGGVDNNTAANHYTTTHGLATSWDHPGLTFVNPPYSTIKQWAAKVAQSAADGSEIIMLCVPRTDTRWFVDHVFGAAQAIAFWHGDRGSKGPLGRSRIQFVDPKTGHPAGSNTGPSCLAYYGARHERFRRTFARYAKVLSP